ncbi:MAG TPA: LptF/LptG family permease [Bryobacteraceae bacterium]|nr:LptF/LptG family permease [Bryobacteraceae bacterium]
MGILGRTVFGEVTTGALLGTILFTFVLFLRSLGRLFEQLVTSSATAAQIGKLFLLILPQTFTITIPVGVLAGILITMGRMSSDGEIIAMRAAGVPSRRILVPILTFAWLGVALAGYASCVVSPWAKRETIRILNEMAAAQLTAEIRPRLFEEQFPNRILYVEDAPPGPVVRWRRVFMADLTPAEQRAGGAGDRGEGPRITLAAEAIAVPDLANNRIQLSLLNTSTYEVGKGTAYFATEFPKGEQTLDAPQKKEVKANDSSELLDMEPLYRQVNSSLESAMEFHRRLALPVACLVLALLAVPLGVSSRKGGKSAAFVMTVTLAFFYYMGSISLTALARQKTLTPGTAVWLPNLIFGLFALILIMRLELPGDRDLSAWFRGRFETWWKWIARRSPFHAAEEGFARGFRLPLLPQLIDTYVLSSFLYYTFALLFSFVMMTHVFNFFELLGDIIKNRIPMARVGTYHLFLTPKLIYDFAPLGVLVAVLVTFGVLAKSNEITAMKACGVSVYRLAAPILVAGCVLAGVLMLFDYYVVPEANLVQDAIRNEIKGRPPQSFLRPDRKWIVGRGPWIYYYKHFDPSSNVMVGVSVYEVDRTNFRLKRHIYAENARWEPAIRRWVFQNGWTREFDGILVVQAVDFLGKTATFPELDEPPTYFLTVNKPYMQMNFHQLELYIRELRQSGSFDTSRLLVQYHKKFAVPMFAFIMALISIPFAFLVGNRGAMAPVGISLGIGIGYLALNQLFEQMGNVGQLPAEMAAWSPDAIFILAGTYFLMRVKT